MDMDPMTRREADKVESILVDLIDELKLLSLLPEEFSTWVRDETVVAAIGSESNHFLQLYEAHAARKAEEKAKAEKEKANAANGSRLEKAIPSGTFHPFLSGMQDNALTSSSSSSASSVGWAELKKESSSKATDSLSASFLAPEDEEEQQRSVKAACFVHTAAQFGDPTDSDGNEAVLQVNDFARLEHDLLDSATTTGYVDPGDLQMHHLSTRALVDTLREGGYGAAMKYFLKRLYPSSYSAGVPKKEREKPNSSANIAQMHVYGCGMVEESVDHLRELVETLRRLIHERNKSTVNEDIHRYQLLHDAVNRDQAGTADVQVLNQRYLDVKASRKREVAELNNAVQQLEEELQYVRQAADVELEALQRVQETIQNDHRCTLRQQLEAHRNAAEAVAHKLLQAQATNLDELNALRSQRTKREAAVSGAIADYDTQTSQLEAAMWQFNQEVEEETERIVRLEAEVQTLQKQKDEYAWELTVAEQRQEHAQVIRQRQEQDARVVQAFYRAYRARLQAQQALEKESKKGKKKGKKKGAAKTK